MPSLMALNIAISAYIITLYFWLDPRIVFPYLELTSDYPSAQTITSNLTRTILFGSTTMWN